MTTSLIASVLLMHRKGLSKDLLHKRVAFIYDEIKARNGNLQINIRPNGDIIQTCLKYLSDFVESKNDIYEPLVSAKQGEKSIMMLAYYRNNMSHIFINEAEIACALLDSVFKMISDKE